MKTSFKIIISIVVVVALGALGAKALKTAKEKEAAAPLAKIYPLVVKNMSAKLQKVQLTLPYLAEVHNDKDVKLSSRLSGRLLSIKSSGTKVKQDEVIATIDTTSLKSNITSTKEQIHATQTALKNLEQTHTRTLELLKVQGASIEQSQKESTAIASLSAKLSSLKQQEISLKNSLSYGVVRAPVNGVISKSYLSKGAMSLPGKPIVSISATNGFYLLVRLPSSLNVAGVIFEDMKFQAVALGSTFHGLSEYKVYVDAQKLSSGDRVEVSVITFDAQATLLPFDAVLNRDSKSYVLVLDGKQAHAKEIYNMQSGEQGVAVLDDLQGTQLITAKPDILLKLVAGHTLRVKE